MSGVPPRRIAVYDHASDLPAEFWAALRRNEPAANVIFPFANKALGFPREANSDQFWIIQYEDAGNDVEFVLSCTRGLLGNYPIFVYTPKSSAQLTQEEKHVADSMLQLVLCLLEKVLPQRVFSVFSVALVAEKFAEIFQEQTHQTHGIRALKDSKDLYYDAIFTFCTRETLNKSPFSSLLEPQAFLIALRRADISSLEGIKVLCREFSCTSRPYILDDERAESEARALITNQQAWVHMIKRSDDEEWETACLVAATRESENVTTITKVFTAEKWRGHGCAARLLHRVCEEVLRTKEKVVLYVGNTSEVESARRVYHKVGFQGLDEQKNVENVERWIEIGFEGTTLGHW